MFPCLPRVNQHNYLTSVSSCMKITMTIGGAPCSPQVLINELTCRIPKGVVIPRTGLPVKVRVASRRSD